MFCSRELLFLVVHITELSLEVLLVVTIQCIWQVPAIPVEREAAGSPPYMFNVFVSQKRMSILHGIFGKRCEPPSPLWGRALTRSIPRGGSPSPQLKCRG